MASYIAKAPYGVDERNTKFGPKLKVKIKFSDGQTAEVWGAVDDPLLSTIEKGDELEVSKTGKGWKIDGNRTRPAANSAAAPPPPPPAPTTPPPAAAPPAQPEKSPEIGSNGAAVVRTVDVYTRLYWKIHEEVAAKFVPVAADLETIQRISSDIFRETLKRHPEL